MTMLLYKAWLETRARFLICLLGSTCLCLAFVLHAQSQGLPDTKPWYYYMTLFYAHQWLVGMWILSSVLLGMGGLVRESSMGSAPFTLALPVSRRQIAFVRIALGILQMVLLAALPWAAICVATIAAGHPVVWSQVFHYLTILICGGVIYFSLAVLVSSAVEKEYTAPTVALGVIIVTALLPGIVASLKSFSVLRLMSGSGALDKATYLLQGPLPWPALLASLILGALLIQAAIFVVDRREF